MDHKLDAIRLLQFLVHSKRPLTLAEAKEVIATQIEGVEGFHIKRRLFCETDLLKHCPGLAKIVQATEKELQGSAKPTSPSCTPYWLINSGTHGKDASPETKCSLDNKDGARLVRWATQSSQLFLTCPTSFPRPLFPSVLILLHYPSILSSHRRA